MFKAVLILVFGSLLGGLVLTPPIYSLLEYVFGNPLGWPFSRVFDRAAMLVAAILLLVLRKKLSLQLVYEKVFKGRTYGRILHVVLGVVAALTMSFIVLGMTVGGGEIVWVSSVRTDILLKMLTIIPIALLISVIEEGFFRCILLERLASTFPFFVAASVSSLIYAFVHFITPVKDFVYTEFEPLAGFRYVVSVMERLASAGVVDAGLGLFLVGMVLCFVVRVTGSLFLCIGLHAGWVIALKFSRFTTQAAPGYEFASGIGHRYFLVAQPLTWLSLLMLILLVVVSRRRLALGGGVCLS